MLNNEISHKKIEFLAGRDITHAVNLLLEHKERGERVYGIFNGQPLYSDSVTEDVAYMLIIGQDRNSFEEEQKRRADEAERRHQEHIRTIPEQTKRWIVRGMDVLEFDKWDHWARIVPIRLEDLYQGMELGQALDLIELMQEEKYQEAKELLDTQGHSGMSYSLMKQMLIELDSRGKFFVDNFLERD